MQRARNLRTELVGMLSLVLMVLDENWMPQWGPEDLDATFNLWNIGASSPHSNLSRHCPRNPLQMVILPHALGCVDPQRVLQWIAATLSGKQTHIHVVPPMLGGRSVEQLS